MGKLLKILTVVFLVLSVVALVLGYGLFSKRELLKGRTQKLENALIELGRFIEAESPEPQTATYTAKDVSECTAEIPESVDRSDFWRKYQSHLEKANLPTIDLSQRKAELMSYYLRDPITQKIQRDEYGLPVTKGKGTMQYVLDEMLAKAEDQLKRFNETRSQLAMVREELVRTIEELNTRKARLRETLAEVAQLKTTITEKDEKIAAQQREIEDLQSSLQSKEEEITRLHDDLAKLEEEKKSLQQDVEYWKSKVAAAPVAQEPTRRLDPGIKGKVASVNPDWNFAVVSLNDEFMRGVLGEDKQGEFRPVELLVKRADAVGTFVTKVKITAVEREKNLGIADIITEWQRAPIQEGDILFY